MGEQLSPEGAARRSFVLGGAALAAITVAGCNDGTVSPESAAHFDKRSLEITAIKRENFKDNEAFYSELWNARVYKVHPSYGANNILNGTQRDQLMKMIQDKAFPLFSQEIAGMGKKDAEARMGTIRIRHLLDSRIISEEQYKSLEKVVSEKK